MGKAGGVLPVWLGVWGTVGIVVVLNGPRVAEALTSALLSLVLTFIGPIIVLAVLLALASRIPGASGCLMVLPSLLSRGGGRRRVRERPGWDLLIDGPSGLVPVRLASDAPLTGGEEVVVHGPVFGGVKHAWLFQCLSPRPYTRVGRGVLGLLVGVLVWLPLMIMLMVNL